MERNIRYYILETRARRPLWGPYYQGTSDLQDVRDVVDSTANLGKDAAALSQSVFAKRRAWQVELNNAVESTAKAYERRIESNILNKLKAEREKEAELQSTDSGHPVRPDYSGLHSAARTAAQAEAESYKSKTKKKIKKAQQSGTPLEDVKDLSNLTGSSEYEIAKMGRVVANWNLAVQSIESVQAGFENIATVSTIVANKLKEKQVRDNTIVDCKDILDKAYFLKDEGERRFQALQKELNSLNESAFTWIKEAVKNLVLFFQKSFYKQTSDLVQRAKRIK